MKKNIQLLVLLLLLLSLSSCRMFKKPTIERIHDLRIVSMTPDNTSVLISVQVNNPNSYKLILKELNLKLLDRDRAEVGTATMNNRIMIPGRRSTNIDFTVQLETRKAARMISHTDQVLFFYIVGEGKGKALYMNKSFSFEEPYELNLHDYLSDLVSRFNVGTENLFRLQRTQIVDWGLTSTDVHSNFILMNPYGFSFVLSSFPGEVYINDRLVGTASLVRPLHFTEDVYSREGTLLLRVQNFRAILNALGGVLRGEIPYRVRGTVNINAFGMEISKPYEYRGTVPFDISELIF